ncbi:MAG: hypothetical protein IAG13_10235, partial [Deltaproteobacteria bacterium]|nr:hypothetical protein [Nannocystaceae bacterium]
MSETNQNSLVAYGFKLPLIGAAPGTEPTIAVFHDWIRTRVFTDDVLIDVADYGHVKGGPGVLLVCHEGHYVIDHGRGQVGLAYHRRRGEPSASADETARVALARLVRAARLLERDERVAITFDTTALEVRALDRLHAPNDDEGWAVVEGPLRAAITAVWGEPPV